MDGFCFAAFQRSLLHENQNNRNVFVIYIANCYVASLQPVFVPLNLTFRSYKSASWNCSSGKSMLSSLFLRANFSFVSTRGIFAFRTMLSNLSFICSFKRWTCFDKFGRPSKTKMYEAKFQQSTLVLTNLQRQLLN